MTRLGRKPSVTRTLVGTKNVNLEHYTRNLTVRDTGCIEWTGSINNAGYGLIGYIDDVNKKSGMITVHRLALMLKLGRDLTAGLNANHTCHNRVCCNPDHLFEGTQQQKLEDMKEAGRFFGRTNGHCNRYLHKQENRTYQYSDEFIQWHRTASLDEIVSKLNCTRLIASKRRSMFRRGYAWLPAPETGYISDKRGRKSKKVDS